MEELKVGDSVFVQSYKHNGALHRTWSKALVIDVLKDCYVVVTDHSWVVESDSRRWLTREPAICFYYKNKWFNIISMARRNGIYYYCSSNASSNVTVKSTIISKDATKTYNSVFHKLKNVGKYGTARKSV